ncbi:phospho-acceptor domain-containing protein [Larkinella arboricola]|uniref:histidine kinase n=1 Tax=Larkinella arboricola TaxID=643671 RepID=A0A327X4M5_LARAB|nr:ATP-binding protein [Larkinella arboricola]RAK01967.1 phospho-acceptor domain-containing protein [Larkinella arboricola]
MRGFIRFQRSFLLYLCAFFLGEWPTVCLAQTTDQPVAQNGVLDLSAYAYHSSEAVALTGQWFFRWNQFTDSAGVVRSPEYFTVPGPWRTYTGSHPLFPQDQGHCTYALRIRLSEPGKIWSLRIPPIPTAYKLYVNNHLVAETGRLAPHDGMQPSTESKLVSFLVPGKEAFLLIHVANYHFAYGGLRKNLQFGNPSILTQNREKSLLFSSSVIGALFIIGLYHLLLYAFRRRDRAPFLFGILCLTIGLRELFSSEAIFFLLFPDVDWALAFKAVYSTFPIGIISLTLYLQSLYPTLVSPIIKKIIIAINLAFLALVLSTPATTYAAWATLISPVAILECGYFLWVAVRAAQLKKEGGSILLCDMALLTFCVLNDVLHQSSLIQSFFLLPGSLFIFTLCQCLLLAIRFSTSFRKTEALTIRLQTANETIEQTIFQRQEAEQRKEIEEMKTRFFSNITHEFRTPLTLIISPIEQLLQTVRNDSAAVDKNALQHTLTTVHRNARQLLQLINQLLDLSKLESGHLKVQESQGNIVLFLDDLVNSFQLTAETKGIHLHYEPELIPELLLFDDDKWGKICSNLLSNALKYTPSGGTVWVRLTTDPVASNGHLAVRLSVSDTGYGIAPDELPYIFDRFYQADDSRTRSFEGTGIGLALVKELTDLLNGELTVESQPGQGTTITVVFPVRLPYTDYPLPYFPSFADLRQAELPVSANSFLSAPTLQNAHPEQLPLVLVVEDNDDLRQLMADNLSGSYRVKTATNGQEGWTTCQTELPDLVVSDIMMPLLDGYQLCRLIRQTAQTNHIAVILLTAKAAAESRIEGLTAGANDYVTKPFDLPELQLRVNNLLHYQATQRNFYHLQLTRPTPSARPIPDHSFLNQLYQLLEKHLDNATLTVEDLAVEVGMSSRTLNRKLSTLSGMTVSEFIRTYRLHKATELLKAGHSVSETAYLVGFESPSYFGQCFKDLFALSPSDYIRSVLSQK